MINLGDYNTLEVVSIGTNGVIVSDGAKEILMPTLQCNEYVVVGAQLELFVYRNSNDEIIATTKKAYAKIGDFAALTVVDDNPIGVFLDWGLEKDLLIPHSQMLGKMEIGSTHVVHVLFDDISRRVIATPRLRPFMQKPDEKELPVGTKVSAMIYENRDLGFMAIVNGQYQAMFSRTEFTCDQKAGTVVDAFVKNYTEDEKMTISRAPVGHQGWSDAEETLRALIIEKDGLLPLNDKSTPELISRVTGMSKKSFKKVVGGLYKKKMIEISTAGIRLIEN